MNLEQMKVMHSKLLAEKENLLVQLGAIIGKVELLDLLIGEGEGEAATSPEPSISADEFVKVIGAEMIDEPKPTQ